MQFNGTLIINKRPYFKSLMFTVRVNQKSGRKRKKKRRVEEKEMGKNVWLPKDKFNYCNTKMILVLKMHRHTDSKNILKQDFNAQH